MPPVELDQRLDAGTDGGRSSCIDTSVDEVIEHRELFGRDAHSDLLRRHASKHTRTVFISGCDTGAIREVYLDLPNVTPQRWRIRARLLHATRLLAQGESVTTAALASGYSTPSAFSAAFRNEVGTTPTRYIAGEG